MDDEGAANPDAISMLKILAEDDDFESQKSLSYMYYEGEGIKKDMDKSLFWANVALSNIECNEEEMLTINIRIGYILMTQKDYEGALKKFIDIFNSDELDSKAKHTIHISIADNYYYLKEDSKALEIYNNIINDEHSEITDENKNYIYKNLGVIYINKKDFKLAIDVLHKNLKLKADPDNDVLNNIGFANEMFGNFDDAYKYYLLASEKNSIYANLNLWYLYENGLGVEKDNNKALVYYEKGKDHIDEWKICREKFNI